jgi:hypothetical protein|tara:strand:- start:4290 stop:4790 length:501 start_codon:yes stop_codon:yes gene_type:complete
MHLDHGFSGATATFGRAIAIGIAADLDDRVEHGDHIMPLGTDLAHHRIDDEGAVISDYFENITAELDTVSAGARPDPDQDIIAGTPVSECPELNAEGREIIRRNPLQILRQGVIVDLGKESVAGLAALTPALILPAASSRFHEFRTRVGMRDSDDRPHDTALLSSD